MRNNIFPEEPAGTFPSPATTFTDAADREIRVQVAEDADVGPLMGMYEDFDPEDRAQGIPPTGTDDIREWLNTLFSPDCLNVLAVHDDTPVGHATLVPDRNDTYELAIFVLHTHQGAGIGTALLERLLGHAQDESVEKVWLTVERWNEPAISLYEKTGFETSSSESFELEMAVRL